MLRSSRFFHPLIFTMLFWLLLVACQGGETGGENNAGTGQSTTVSRVRFADAGFKAALYQPLMDAFAAENPGVQIEYVPMEEAADRRSGVLDLFTLATLADTMILPRIAAGAEAGYFQDLADRVEGSAYWPEALAACRTGDIQTAFPLFVTPRLLFVNGDLLADAGLPRPEPGWTWDEFAAAVRAIGATDGVYGFAQEESPAGLFGPTIDRLLPADRSGLDPAVLAGATDWYADLAASGAVLLPDGTVDVQQLIAEGQVAMWLDSPANLPTMRNRMGEDLFVLPYPVGAEPAASTPVTAACAAISAGTAQPEAAWAWLEFLAQNPIVSRRGEIPGRVDVADNSGFWAGIDDDVAATTRYALDHAWYAGVDGAIEAVATALGRAMVAGGDAEAAISEITSLPTPTTAPTAAAVPVVAVAPPVTPPAGAAAGIRFFNGSFETNMATMREVAEAFTARTGRQINFNDFYTVSGVPGGIQSDGTFAYIATEHDCMLWRGPLPNIFHSQVIPLEALLNERYPDLLADYAPHTLEQAKRDGILYGLPLILEPQMWFVNSDRFARKDIPLPVVGWSMIDFEDIVAQMPLGEGRGQIYGYVPYGEFNVDAYEPLLAMYGAVPFDLGAADPAVNFADPATMAALEQVQALIAAGIVASFDGGGTRSFQGNTNEMGQVIQTGRATIWNENMNAASSRFGFFGASFDIQPIPYPASGIPLPAPGMVRLYIFSEAANPEACLDWIATLSDHPQVVEGVPARVSWRESVVWAEEVGAERAGILRDTTDRSTRMPANDDLYQPVFDWWEDALAEIWAGADKVSVLQGAQGKADAYIACIAAADQSVGEMAASVRRCALQVDPEYPDPEPED